MKILMVIPTLNEYLVIKENLQKVLTFFTNSFPQDNWKILVADNGSTDETVNIVKDLCLTEPHLEIWHTDIKGRGQALKTVWQLNTADVYVYMDADLATDLKHVPELIRALEISDIAIGTRLNNQSKTSRSLFREISSRIYNFLVKKIIALPVSDTQCGFKAIGRKAVLNLLPLTKHPGWFFDTELLALAKHFNYHVSEIPVCWQETVDKRRKSRVKILATAWDDIKNLIKLRRKLAHLPKKC